MKSKLFISVAALSLLIGGLVGCNGNKSSEEQKSSQAPASSESAKPSSSSVAPSSSSVAPSSSSSAAPVHEHSYAKVGESVKNADDKDVYLMECADKDDKYIGIAFADYSAIDAAFDSDAKATKYKEVDESIWEDAHMLAKTEGTTISWKINVDKAIEGAKLSLGVTSTYATHGSTNMANEFSVKVNDGALAAWSVTGTYTENGLDPSKRTYLECATINLVAGENTITLSQDSTHNRLLFGGEVRIHYSGDAKPVNAPVPFEGYDVTFVVEHCKVLVYEGKKYSQDPVETLKTKAMDEDGNIIPYDAGADVQPQVNFKVVCDEGYSVNASNISIEGKFKNLKQNPAKKETPAVDDDSIFRITQVQENLTVTITAEQGEQAPGHLVTFVTTNCSVIVYIGTKEGNNATVDTAEKIYTRESDSPYAYSIDTRAQLNFEVVCDDGYEFVPVITDNKVDFIEGTYNKFQLKEGSYNITKIETDLVITITATAIAG